MIFVEKTLCWFTIFLVYSNFTNLAFALTIFLAARHIHVNSKQVESLGIRTSSTLITLYVTFWIGLAIFSVSFLILLIWERVIYISYTKQGINTRKEKTDRDLRITISEFVVLMLLNILGKSLELMILYAYFRLSMKLSAQATKLVTESLKY